jgi:hypothetical protein
VVLGGKSSLGHVLPLLADESDAGVRREAAMAVGTLGNQDAHLAALFGRLPADVETVPAVRDVVWESFDRVWRKLPLQEQLSWAQKLEGYPDEQMELLKDLEPRLAAADWGSAEMLEFRGYVAARAYDLKRYAEAARLWEAVEQQHARISGSGGNQASIPYFKALLRQEDHDKALTYAQPLVADAAGNYRPLVQAEIRNYLTESAGRSDRATLAVFAKKVKAQLPLLMDQEFETFLLPYQNPAEHTSSDRSGTEAGRRTRLVQRGGA